MWMPRAKWYKQTSTSWCKWTVVKIATTSQEVKSEEKRSVRSYLRPHSSPARLVAFPGPRGARHSQAFVFLFRPEIIYLGRFDLCASWIDSCEARGLQSCRYIFPNLLLILFIKISSLIHNPHINKWSSQWYYQHHLHIGLTAKPYFTRDVIDVGAIENFIASCICFYNVPIIRDGGGKAPKSSSRIWTFDTIVEQLNWAIKK